MLKRSKNIQSIKSLIQKLLPKAICPYMKHTSNNKKTINILRIIKNNKVAMR